MNEIPNLNQGQLPIVERFSGRLFSRRIMRRMLLVVAGVITLAVIIYMRVDSHGKAEWENYKQQLTAKGEVLDWKRYTPAPAQDGDNIFKAPKMAEWFGDNGGTFLNNPLEHPVTNSLALRLKNEKTTVDIESSQEAASYLAWSDAFQDDFDAIRTALKRPSARLVSDYSRPFSITLPNATTAKAVADTLAQRARCHLILGQPDKAWQELTLLNEMRRMVERQGHFITPEGDWMSRGVARRSLEVIAKGLELHAWREPQLVALQEQLKQSDFIALHAEALRCGRALLTGAFEYAATEDGNPYKAVFVSGGDGVWSRLKRHPEYVLVALAPRGAMYERATGLSQQFQTIIDAITPANGIIRPGELRKVRSTWKQALEGLPGLLRMQTLVNEGQIACALERYRLAHGTVPDSLDALVPQFIAKLPHDLVNGQPLVYRRTGDAQFLLYSVGWNEVDDSGKDVSQRAHPQSYKEGDWSWATASKLDQ